MNLTDLPKGKSLAEELEAIRTRLTAVQRSDKVEMNFFLVDKYAEEGKFETKDYGHPSELGDVFRDVRARVLEYHLAREAEAVAKLAALGVTA